MDIFFEVKQSPIHGLGLFCKKTVKKNTVFHIETSRPTKQNITHKKDTYILDYYVNPYAYYEGKCVIGHKITSYRNIWTSLHSSVFNEMYVTSKDISMRSNDLVWPSVSEIEYNKQIEFFKVMDKRNKNSTKAKAFFRECLIPEEWCSYLFYFSV